MKQAIPTWSVVVAIILVIALATGLLLTMNTGSADRDTLIRLRTRPGSTPPAAAANAGEYGMPRGTPILHTDTPDGGSSRQKPGP